MVTLTSSSSSSSTPKTSFDLMKSNNLSGHFPSAYLSSKEGALTQRKLIEPSRAVVGTLNMINPEENILVNGVTTPKIAKKEPEEAEIGVFGAEKYFSGVMDSDKSPRLVSLANPEAYSKPRSERFFVDSAKKSSGTPSLRSESSWNSQSVLLQKKHGKNSSCSSLQGKKTSPRVIKKSFLANLGCKCACSDGNSVDVEEIDSSLKQNSVSGILIQETESRKVLTSQKFQQQQEEEEEEEEEEMIHRKSLEVFGSPILEKRSIQKKLAVLPWESSSAKTREERGFSVKYSEEDDESGSDASSDLFEIGSLREKPKPYPGRQGSDPASPTCYAPSEVSIEWSVVTASAADFSVMSECATSPVRNRSIQIPRTPTTVKSNRETGEKKKSSSGLLLGCKSHKSVRVSGDSYRTMNTTTTKPSYVPRFPPESSRRRMSGSSVSHSQSPAGTASSHLLYTH